MSMSNVRRDERRRGGMVLVRNQEWPPHFTGLGHGFADKGANVLQNRNGLYVDSLAGSARKLGAAIPARGATVATLS